MARRGTCLVLLVLLAGCGPVIEISRPESDTSAGGATAEPSDAPAAEHDEDDAAPGPLLLAFGGDVHGEPPVSTLLGQGGNPLDGVAPVLRSSDLALVNLETPVGTSGSPAPKQFTFQAPASLLDALAGAGVDVVSVANNHSLDYGVEGLAETIDLARAAGLAVVGGGRDADEAYAPHYTEVEGGTVAVVGLTRVIPYPEWAATDTRSGLASTYEPGLERSLAAIAEARARAEWVVVAVHWGEEGQPCPNPVQRELARAYVDAGADVVAGHHPHVLQGVQEIDGAIVAYSLGNFVWYATSEAGRTTGVLTVALHPDGAADWELHPARIDGDGSPQPLTGTGAQDVRALVADRSPGGSACAHIDWP